MDEKNIEIKHNVAISHLSNCWLLVTPLTDIGNAEGRAGFFFLAGVGGIQF